MKFKKILIANRGEIALRIIKTCREMGIKTVAIYPSEVDKKDFLEVGLADESYCLEEQGILGYLDQKRIIQIAKKSESDAIHPGYGFLSENSDFAQLCEQNNIKFIGPSPEVLHKLGNKIEAKKIAKKVGFPLIHATNRPIKDENECFKMAKKIGVPFLLKATDGGGGRGILLIRELDKKDILEKFNKIKREATRAFGKGDIFIEKFLEHPHHIEFQILGDGQGRVVHFFERECSIQRKNQKLIEEAPSPFLDKGLRKKMAKKALKLGKFLKYEGVGTVEFLVDKNKKFYFLEVNPRIQVEHPVTELITRVDLVAWQIRIAEGEKLDLKQKNIKVNGWAMEFRINSEDPVGFNPSFGEIKEYKMPEGKGVEIHSGYKKGTKVLPFFDPLLLKLVVWADTREKVIKRSEIAMKELKIKGVKSLIPLYRLILKNEKFIEGDFTTSFLDQHPEIFKNLPQNGQVKEIEEKEDIQEEQIAFLVAQLYKDLKDKKEPLRINKWQLVHRLNLFEK